MPNGIVEGSHKKAGIKKWGTGGIGVGKKYVQQLPLRTEEELIRMFFSDTKMSKSTILNDIGILSARGSRKSTQVLVDALSHPDREVRHVAIDYLGDLPKGHPMLKEACAAVEEMIAQEPSEAIRIIALRAQERLKKFQKMPFRC